MRRIVLGVALALHGLAHTTAGMRVTDDSSLTPTLLWAVATVALLAASFGLLGLRPLRRHWQLLSLVGIASSLVLLVFYRPVTALSGVAIDLALLGVLGFGSVRMPEWRRPERGIRAAIGSVIAFATLVYVGAAILSRPWHKQWGSRDTELRAVLPGDDIVPNPHYTIQHAVTIHAPPAEVWPWLVQLGQDRGGFYSYDWLERLVGDDIRNADRLHPEWQTLGVGDLVRATQPSYLGGIFGPNLGWRVTRLEPERVVVLGGWGAFVLEPEHGVTRLIVRTRGAGKPSIALAPIGLLVFEPAHFIMQRRMLLGIRDRVEKARGASSN
jgi:hypothetical protein